MGNPLIDLLVAVIALAAIVGTVGLLGSRNLYDRIGAGGTALPDEDDGAPARSPEAAARERDLEIRQMLQARSERLQRQGRPPLDIDAEAARLQDPHAARPQASDAAAADRSHDPELLGELRQLIDARNERRMRAGQQPLDVEAELTRRLADLDL